MDTENSWEDYDEDNDPDYEPDDAEMQEDEDNDEDSEVQMEDELERGAVDNDEVSQRVVINIGDLLAGNQMAARNWGLLAAILASHNRNRAMRQLEDDGDDDEDEQDNGQDNGDDWWPRGSSHFRYAPDEKPNPKGQELLESGWFGRPSDLATTTKEPLQKTLRGAKLGLSLPSRSSLLRGLVPNSIGTVVARYGANVYGGQFSTDSTFYYTCVQDFKLHIYDTKAPISARPHRDMAHDHVTTMKHKTSIRAHHGGWTITDSHLSPDNRLIAYAIMSPNVWIASTQDDDVQQRSLFFGQSRSNAYNWHDQYGVWSCRFSADGKEVVAGGNGKLMVYDLIADKRSVLINAHDEDVNSCCWADSSGNVLISASDDSFIKVWDRRSLSPGGASSGVLIGHTEGITYVSPKGDGRYIVSNGKDQTLKLWDLRKMSSTRDYLEVRRDWYGTDNFDYRAQVYPKPKYQRHPYDCSIMSYRGHSVLRTLIRCNFSPAETTGSRYIYSGSADGIIHIWSLDGTVVQRIDRRNVLDMTNHPSDTEKPHINTGIPGRTRNGVQMVVRDVAWHTQEPVLLSCSWATDQRGKSEVARHEWKGLNKLGNRLEDFVEKEQRESQERARSGPLGRWYEY